MDLGGMRESDLHLPPLLDLPTMFQSSAFSSLALVVEVSACCGAAAGVATPTVSLFGARAEVKSGRTSIHELPQSSALQAHGGLNFLCSVRRLALPGALFGRMKSLSGTVKFFSVTACWSLRASNLFLLS
jgi:hypothetical protein